MPLPCAGDDLIELGEAGLPAEFGFDLFGAGDEDGGISRSAFVLFNSDGTAGDATNGVDDLAYGESLTAPEVVDETAVLAEGFEGEHVGIGEIADVDVVANAGSVLGGIVLTEDLDARAAAQGDVEDERNEVRLGLVRLAVAFDGAGDVEVAEAGVAQAVDAVDPGEHVFDEELAFAVGVGGQKAGVFGDGSGFWFAVAGGCGTEDDAVVAGGEHGLKQREGGDSVVAEVELGELHAFAGFNESGEVHDSVEAGFAKDGLDEGAVCEIC